MPVNEDEWVRRQTPEGQTYYFNRSTGASQWNLPNAFYESSMGTTAKASVKFPSIASSMLNVNCVTEVLPKMASTPATEPSVSLTAADVNLHNVRSFRGALDPDVQRDLNDPEFSARLMDTFDELDQEGRLSVPFDEAASALLEVCDNFGLDVPIEVLGELANRYLADPTDIHRAELVPFAELLVTKVFLSG